METPIRGDEARMMSESLLKKYFRTQNYPFTRHHIESQDQFLSQDLPAIVKASNPVTLLQDPIGSTGAQSQKTEIFIGGLNGDRLFIGSPTVSLKDKENVRLLYPNEARLRNLTYSSIVQADLVIRITFSKANATGGAGPVSTLLMDPATDPQYSYLGKQPLFRIPIMLHSQYCVLNGKPQAFLREAGECVQDQGGQFIVDGSEKVLITRQEQAFNTLQVTPQDRDPKVKVQASISCLNPTTRQVKRIAFSLTRRENTIQVMLPFVRAPIPLFVVFRAMGIQSDEEILRTILPDPDSAETQILEPLLHESILDAFPILTTYAAVNFIKVFTKGFSEAHVLDILHNQTFIHVENRSGARATFLAECVRKILRVAAGIDPKTDRDDTRNQRCLTSGVLTRMLFQGAYSSWLKAMTRAIDMEYKFNPSIYAGESFKNLFLQGNITTLFRAGMLTDGIMRGFKGKWGSGMGEEKSGVLQALSRLSYMDFLSHCRRVVLDFDTGMKLPGPRRLNTSQFGQFCTNETPGGASIGITKNLSMLAAISTSSDPLPFTKWLIERVEVIPCDQVTTETIQVAVPVQVNGGIVGYTLRPLMLKNVLKVMKWTGCLPASASVGFSIRDRRVFVFLDEGRPIRPLIHLGPGGSIPLRGIQTAPDWRTLVLGNYPMTAEKTLQSSGFVDPLSMRETVTLEEQIKELTPQCGVIEQVDPQEANEAQVACYSEDIQKDTSHMEIHPSTILGLMTSVIPYPHHNQSPRNQLSCSQSKQGISVQATNQTNRFDNQVHVMCYGEAPLVRTLYTDQIADGQMGQGHNLVLALGCFTGQNQEDGIVMNADSFQRGMFHNMTFRGQEAQEEDDEAAQTRTRIGNPAKIPGWTSLRAGIDYSKLDDRGIVRVGEQVDENTAIVGRQMQGPTGDMRDASVTAQVWTSGRVEKVSITVSNAGLALVKIRVAEYREPELGDKFSNRHGQKGTIGMLIRAHDMPRSASGMVPDMMMNPHAIPSRMTMGQMLEALLGKAAAPLGAVGDATAFMNDGSPGEAIGKVLQEQLGMEPLGEELLQDGTTGCMIPSQIFLGNVQTMRLKHMVQDKWNARAEGRREQRTHQPTGGRGNQGGLRIGEMERDALVGHGITSFLNESIMKRADGSSAIVCNGCGTIPIQNEKENFQLCPMCDGPVQFIGETATNLEILPPLKRSITTFSKVEIPQAMKLLDQEMNTQMNMGMRVLTTKGVQKLKAPRIRELTEDEAKAALAMPLPERILPETELPVFLPPEEKAEVRLEDLAALGAIPEVEEEEEVAPAPSEPVSIPTAPPTVALGPTTNGLPTVNLSNLTMTPSAANAAANAAAAPNSNNIEILEEVNPDSFPMDETEPPVALGPSASLPGLNVTANTSPVLIMPVNVNAGPPATEQVPPPVPGAPPTIAVDTSNSAMNATGIPASTASRPPPARSALRNATRKRANRGVSFASNLTGGSSAPSAPSLPQGSNVRVMVNKLG